jgi:hypothetical protein
MVHRRSFFKTLAATSTGLLLDTRVNGPVFMEYNYGGRPPAYHPEFMDFKAGKICPIAVPALASMSIRPGSNAYLKSRNSWAAAKSTAGLTIP